MARFPRSVILPLIVALLTLTLAAQQQGPPPTQAQQRPVFRGGTNFVRVDAYPTENGQIVEGLKAEDFEIFEDGKAQAIESFDFVRFATFTPIESRRDPSSQREGFDKAADPRYRVFVILVDVKSTGIAYIQKPLVQFLDRVLGPGDLFGLLTTNESAKDLMLGQRTEAAEEVIADMWRSANIDRDEADELDACGIVPPPVKARFRLDRTYVALESLTRQLGSLRQERKNVIFVANSLPRLGADPKILERRGPVLPKIGIVNGRVGIGDHAGPAGNDSYCASEIQRLALMDFDERYRELLREARQQNVSFYTITPQGLQMQRPSDDLIALAHETDGIAIYDTNDLSGGMRKIADDLAAYYVLGYYTTNTDFNGAIRTIKVRLKSNGKTIRARKQYRAPTRQDIAALTAPASARSSGAAVPAATPASAELSALAALPPEHSTAPFHAFASRAGSELSIVLEVPGSVSAWPAGAEIMAMAESADGEVVGSARVVMKSGGRVAIVHLQLEPGKPPAYGLLRIKADGMTFTDRVAVPPASPLLGDALAFRNGTPTGALACRRNDVVHLEWAVLGPLDTRAARLLDRRGKPLAVPLQLEEKNDASGRRLVTDVPLAQLGRGEYLVELIASSKVISDRKLIALRIE